MMICISGEASEPIDLLSTGSQLPPPSSRVHISPALLLPPNATDTSLQSPYARVPTGPSVTCCWVCLGLCRGYSGKVGAVSSGVSPHAPGPSSLFCCADVAVGLWCSSSTAPSRRARSFSTGEQSIDLLFESSELVLHGRGGLLASVPESCQLKQACVRIAKEVHDIPRYLLECFGDVGIPGLGRGRLRCHGLGHSTDTPT